VVGVPSPEESRGPIFFPVEFSWSRIHFFSSWTGYETPPACLRQSISYFLSLTFFSPNRAKPPLSPSLHQHKKSHLTAPLRYKMFRGGSSTPFLSTNAGRIEFSIRLFFPSFMKKGARPSRHGLTHSSPFNEGRIKRFHALYPLRMGRQRRWAFPTFPRAANRLVAFSFFPAPRKSNNSMIPRLRSRCFTLSWLPTDAGQTVPYLSSLCQACLYFFLFCANQKTHM